MLDSTFNPLRALTLPDDFLAVSVNWGGSFFVGVLQLEPYPEWSKTQGIQGFYIRHRKFGVLGRYLMFGCRDFWGTI